MVTMECQPREDSEEVVVQIVDGNVTGYEGCYYSDNFKDFVREKGWWACAGSSSWDSLFIPPKEMMTVLEKFKLVRNN